MKCAKHCLFQSTKIHIYVNKTRKNINQRVCYNNIWSWSPMPREKHGPQILHPIRLIVRWVRSQRCSCLVTWFCHQLIAKPGNKTALLPWPDPFLYARLKNGRIMPWQCPCRGNVRPSVRPSVRVFRTFLQHALRYQFETWYIHSVGGTTCRVWVASQLGHFDLVYSQK